MNDHNPNNWFFLTFAESVLHVFNVKTTKTCRNFVFIRVYNPSYTKVELFMTSLARIASTYSPMVEWAGDVTRNFQRLIVYNSGLFNVLCRTRDVMHCWPLAN